MQEMELQKLKMEDDRVRKQKELELKMRDETRRDSEAGLVKYYGDALKYSLAKMTQDPAEYPAFFSNVERTFESFKVPKELWAKLLTPLLAEKVKALMIKLPADAAQNYQKIRDFVLREFHLTAEKYRERFYTAGKRSDETFTVFGSRLKTYFNYYLDSREVKDKEQVIELLVADRLKQCLPVDCLNHILAAEGEDWFDVHKLGHQADVYMNSHACSSRHFSASSKSTVKRSRSLSHSDSTPKSSFGQKDVLNASSSSSSDVPKFGYGSGAKSSMKCWRCGQIGHKSIQCSSAKAESSEKGTPQRPPKSESAITQVKTNYLIVEKERDLEQNMTTVVPKYIPDHVQQLRIPDRAFYTKMEQHFCTVVPGYENFCELSEETNFGSQNVDDEFRSIENEGSEIMADPVVNFMNVSKSIVDSDAEVMAHRLPESILPDLESQILLQKSEFEDNGKQVPHDLTTDRAHVDCQNTKGDKPSVQISPLQYVHVNVKGLSETVCALNDSGSEICLINSKLISDLDVSTQGQVKIRNVIGSTVIADLVTLQMKPHPGVGYKNIAPYIPVVFATCPLVDVDMILSSMVLDQLHTLSEYDLVTGISDQDQMSSDCKEVNTIPLIVDAVTTRSQAKSKDISQLTDGGVSRNQTRFNTTPNLEISDLDGVVDLQPNTRALDTFITEQKSDSTLTRAWDLAGDEKGGFFVKDGLLFHRDLVLGIPVNQVCLPSSHRKEVCEIAHNLAHQGVRKTVERVRTNFYWDGLTKFVKDFVSSCLQCQA